MKYRWIGLLCLALALLIPTAALGEALPVEGDAVAVLDGAEAPVEELDLTLGDIGPGEEESVPEALGALMPNAGADDEASPLPEEPLSAQVVKVTKSASKSVYLGVPGILDVKGGIKSVTSSAKKVATASKDGTLTLLKAGKAKLTITTKQKKKFTVTLTVNPVPAPTGAKVTAKGGSMKLSWIAAPYATGYLVQWSNDGKAWSDFRQLPSATTSLDITAAVTGPIWFRVTAILGADLGGTSEKLPLLAPLTGVGVICQETYYNGPTDKLNVVWDPCGGAEHYEIYHTVLPSQDYALIGTTTENWYPFTRSKTGLDAFKVRPVSDIVDLPASDPVTLWTGYQDNVLPPDKLTSSTGIILVVNKKAQVVTAYVQDAQGKYTIPLRHMICSSGKVYDRTKNGTYVLKARKGEWYQYPGGYYIRWPSIYRDGYYFHSPLYNPRKSLSGGTVDKLGTRQSLGCIRLKVKDADWVYHNCPKGTAVYICDGAKKANLLKALKPKDVKVKGF